jgi:hypothetical protein
MSIKIEDRNYCESDLVIGYKNRSTKLNLNLIKKQGINKATLQKIKTLHLHKLMIYDLMDQIDNSVQLKNFDQILTELEFELQDAWGFPRDARYHKFWNRPCCACAKLDNEDAYPTGYYNYNDNCLLHGQSQETQKVAKTITK